MVVKKDRLKKKLLKKLEDEEKTFCSICRKEIKKEDIEKENFEYCKSSLNENYAHTECVKEMINK